MLTLTMKNDLGFRLNLKTFEEEKQVYYKWYSMSDIPRCHHKFIEFETVNDEPGKFKVSDIKDCKFEEKIYDKKIEDTINGLTENLLKNALNSLIP